MAINVTTSGSFVFPDTAVPGDQITKLFTVTGIVQPPNQTVAAQFTTGFNGQNTVYGFQATIETPDVTPSFTVTSTPQIAFAVISAAPKDGVPGTWEVEVQATLL